MKFIPDIVLEPNDSDNQRFKKLISESENGSLWWMGIGTGWGGNRKKSKKNSDSSIINSIPKYRHPDMVRIKNHVTGDSFVGTVIGTCSGQEYRVKYHDGKQESTCWATADITNKQYEFSIQNKLRI